MHPRYFNIGPNDPNGTGPVFLIKAKPMIGEYQWADIVNKIHSKNIYNFLVNNAICFGLLTI